MSRPSPIVDDFKVLDASIGGSPIFQPPNRKREERETARCTRVITFTAVESSNGRGRRVGEKSGEPVVAGNMFRNCFTPAGVAKKKIKMFRRVARLRRAAFCPAGRRGVTFAGCDVENWIQVWGGV